MASFIEAVQLRDSRPNTYTGAPGNVLDTHLTTDCDMFLNGNELTDYMRLRTGPEKGKKALLLEPPC